MSESLRYGATSPSDRPFARSGTPGPGELKIAGSPVRISVTGPAWMNAVPDKCVPPGANSKTAAEDAWMVTLPAVLIETSAGRLARDVAAPRTMT